MIVSPIVVLTLRPIGSASVQLPSWQQRGSRGHHVSPPFTSISHHKVLTKSSKTFKSLANDVIFASLSYQKQLYTTARRKITNNVINGSSEKHFSFSCKQLKVIFCPCSTLLSLLLTSFLTCHSFLSRPLLLCLLLLFTQPGAICRPRRSVLIKSGTQRGGILNWAANLCGDQGHFC